MLRGYRLLLVAVGGLSLLIALGTGSYFGALYGYNQKQYQAVTGNQSRHNDYSGPSQSLPDISGLPGPVERAIANPHPATGQDHEIRDLAAQEASALWAFWMVAASVASVLITTVGTILLYKQIVLTRRAVIDTGLATKAMQDANDIAGTGVRAWLSIELTFDGVGRPWNSGELGNGFAFDLVARIENHGSAPGNDVHFNADILFPQEGEDIWTPMREFCDNWRQGLTDTDYSGGIVGFPRQSITEMPQMLFISEREIDAATASKENKWISPRVVGCVSYRTPHASGVRQTRFMGVLSKGATALDVAVPNWWQGPIVMDCNYMLAD